MNPFHLRPCSQVSLVLGMALAFGANAQPKVGVPTQNAYSCVDASGRKLSSDRLIAACMDREQREISPSGTARVVSPRATAKELEAQAETARIANEKRRAEQKERAAERALMTRYPNRAAFDAARAESLRLPANLIKSAQNRMAVLTSERAKLDLEMEFYAKNPNRAPAELRRKFDSNETEMSAQQLAVSNQQAEAKRINERYNQDLAKLQAMWR